MANAATQVATQAAAGLLAPSAIKTNLYKQADFKLTYLSIMIVVVLAASYLVVASLGIDMFSKCKELAGIKTQEDLNKWLIATLGIAIAMPFTLFLTKLSGNYLNYIVAILFAVLGIVASSAVIHWNRKCSEVDDSQKAYGGVMLALSIALIIGTLGLLIRARGSAKVAARQGLGRARFQKAGRQVIRGRRLYM